MKAFLKRWAAPVGLTSSRPLYESMALAAYRRKLRRDPSFREWTERERERWVVPHWGHYEVTNEFDTLHLCSQLYELTRLLRARLPATEGIRVLDAGASDGLFLASLGVKHGVGVNFLEPCARKILEAGYSSCLADIGRLPFPDQAFDVVLCCETLEHVPDPIGTLNELLRVCRERVYLTIPWMKRTRITARPEGWPNVESHIFEFDEGDFARILSHTRARVLHRGVVQVFPEPRNPLLQWWFQTWMYGSYFPRLQYYELGRETP